MVVVGDHPQDRLLDVAAGERRLRPVRGGFNRHRHQRDRRYPRVDQRDRDRPHPQHPLQVTRLELELGREVAGCLDPRVGDRRDHQRVDEVLDGRRAEEVQLVGQPVGVEHHDQPHDDHQQLQTQLRESQHDQPPLAVSAGHVRDVEDRGQRDHQRRDRQLHIAPAERPGDRRQVVRDRDRRRCDHDQVVDQDRPARDEADQLVERVAGEGRRAAPLPEHRAPLDVGERGEREHQPGQQEDHRRQAQPAVGHHADREVDREPHRGGGRGIEEGHTEPALHHRSALLIPASRGTAVPSRAR